ncbi:hypothetical protein [Herbaspirillum sp. C9C3]|uniref:hypothetical protein n=1 Tax=Herbaspirillum sp. C9C3 TaxID=2735271 RepID=UPI001584E47C|nr:hypothetical protein [Herbaspirillum sp. C9C3]NUT62799.1 hypothetical protein [Herbaspirillum sp. C9C3]
MFRREKIDYVDLALWDSHQIVDQGDYKGKTALSVFTSLPRGSVRLGTAGKIMTATHAAEVLDEGCDFVLLGRAAILQRDYPWQVRLNQNFKVPETPVTADFLRTSGLSENFIDYMNTAWTDFVA